MFSYNIKDTKIRNQSCVGPKMKVFFYQYVWDAITYFLFYLLKNINFVEKLIENISFAAKNFYYEVKRTTIDELMRPHLAIYLDMPVEKIQQKIKERNRPHEQNSKALSTSFLAALEDGYKRQYLKEIRLVSIICLEQ